MQILQIIVASIIAVASFWMAEKNLTLILGCLAGASVLFILTSLIGHYIVRTHISRLEKRERDYFLEIQHSVEKEQYE